MKRLIGALVILCASLPTAASASYTGTMTGNQLLDLCGPGVSGQAPNPSIGMCAGYVQGVYESLTLSGAATICPRANVTVGQVVDMVVDSLKRYPQIRDLEAPIIVIETIKKAFPCKPT
jgi:hypothetical protein